MACRRRGRCRRSTTPRSSVVAGGRAGRVDLIAPMFAAVICRDRPDARGGSDASSGLPNGDTRPSPRSSIPTLSQTSGTTGRVPSRRPTTPASSRMCSSPDRRSSARRSVRFANRGGGAARARRVLPATGIPAACGSAAPADRHRRIRRPTAPAGCRAQRRIQIDPGKQRLVVSQRFFAGDDAPVRDAAIDVLPGLLVEFGLVLHLLEHRHVRFEVAHHAAPGRLRYPVRQRVGAKSSRHWAKPGGAAPNAAKGCASRAPAPRPDRIRPRRVSDFCENQMCFIGAV